MSLGRERGKIGPPHLIRYATPWMVEGSEDPIAPIANAVKALRADLDLVMDDDEDNRRDEYIEASASRLVAALEEWLGPIT